jgi:hypothetical protein
MFYTKGSVVGYSGEGKSEVIRFKFNCLMSDNDLERILETLREQFNQIGDALHFKLNLESEDF